MRRSLVVAAVLVLAAGSLSASPLTWRPAEVMKPMSFLAYADFSYVKTTRGYYWSTETWEDLPDESQRTLVRVLPAVYFSPLKNLEAGIVAPVASHSQGDSSSFGLGDVWFNARYGIIQLPLVPVRLTASAAVVLPTAPEDAYPPLGDRTLDIGAALLLQTRSFAGVAFHARAGYWLNGSYTLTGGEVDTKVDVGDGLEWLVKVDYSIVPMVTGWVALGGTTEGNATWEDIEVPNSSSDRAAVWAGVELHPLPLVDLGLRPKFGYALEPLSKGGAMAPWEAALDVWVAMP